MVEVESYFLKNYPNLKQNIKIITMCKTLAFDLIFSGEVGILLIADSTQERETAAALAILQELGKNLYDFEKVVENHYNKSDLTNNGVIAQYI